MYRDVERILISTEQIQTRVKQLAQKITEDYQGESPLFVAILKGSIMFYADLLRQVELPLQMDFMAISSYGNATKSSGEVKILKDLDKSVEGKSIVIVEDIVDSGNTLSYLKNLLNSRKPKSVKICTLLDKKERRVTDIQVDYVGFDIADEFVIGYGLDYAEKYRNLPYIGVLKKEIYFN